MKTLSYNNMYSISEEGIVYSKYRKGGIVKAFVDTSNYMRIGLVVEGKKKKFLLHRLLAETYIENPENLPYVNHIDGNKLNNALDNLEWCTSSYNQKHAYSNGLKSVDGELNPRDILSEEEVLTIYKRLLRKESTIGIAREYNVSKSCISSIKSKKNWYYLLKDFPNCEHNNKSSRLTEEMVIYICKQFECGYKPTALHKHLIELGEIVTIHQLEDIKRKKCFKHITKDYKW